MATGSVWGCSPVGQRWKWPLLWTAALAVICLSWAVLQQAAGQAAGQPYQVEWRSPIPVWTWEQAGQMQRREEERALLEGRSDRFVLWNQQPGQELSSQVASTTGTVLYLWGDSRSWLGQPLLEGEWLSSEDSEGCLLTSALAWELFGSQQVTGLTVQTPQGPRTVRGVLESSQPLLACQPDPSQTKEAVFSSVSLLLEAGETQPAQAAQAFSLRHALPDGVTRLDHGMGSRILAAGRRLLVLGMLALWLAGPGAFWRAFSVPWQRRSVFWGLLAAGMLLTLWGLHIPAEWVPTRWSDFSFWERTASSWGERLRALLAAQTLFPTQPFAGQLAQAAGGLLAGAGAMWLEQKSAPHLAAGAGVRLTAAVLVAGAVSLASGQGLWDGGFALLLLLLVLPTRVEPSLALSLLGKAAFS